VQTQADAAAYEQQQQQAAMDQAAQQAPAAAPASDTTAQLKELADLKAQGVLTEEEFAAEKAKILAQ
jgi:hypothetical protein